MCDLVAPPVPQRHEIQALTFEQAQHLLQVAHEHKLETLLTLAVATGMRRGELPGLRWQDIDFHAGCLYVRRSVGRAGKYGIVVSEPKTPTRSRRKIMLPAFMIEALKRHQEQQRVMREKAGTEWKENDIVFCVPKVRFVINWLPKDFSVCSERNKPYLPVKSVLAAVFMWQG